MLQENVEAIRAGYAAWGNRNLDTFVGAG